MTSSVSGISPSSSSWRRYWSYSSMLPGFEMSSMYSLKSEANSGFCMHSSIRFASVSDIFKSLWLGPSRYCHPPGTVSQDRPAHS